MKKKSAVAALVEEHEAWRRRMLATTQSLKDNPHRTRRDDAGRDGFFRSGVFIPCVDRETVDLAFGTTKGNEKP